MATSTIGDAGTAASLAERFAGLWDEFSTPGASGGEAPDVVAFLGEHPDATTTDRLAVVLVDQRARLRAGRGRLVEDYLREVPELAAHAALAAELVRGEQRVRLDGN